MRVCVCGCARACVCAEEIMSSWDIKSPPPRSPDLSGLLCPISLPNKMTIRTGAVDRHSATCPRSSTDTKGQEPHTRPIGYKGYKGYKGGEKGRKVEESEGIGKGFQEHKGHTGQYHKSAARNSENNTETDGTDRYARQTREYYTKAGRTQNFPRTRSTEHTEKWKQLAPENKRFTSTETQQKKTLPAQGKSERKKRAKEAQQERRKKQNSKGAIRKEMDTEKLPSAHNQPQAKGVQNHLSMREDDKKASAQKGEEWATEQTETDKTHSMGDIEEKVKLLLELPKQLRKEFMGKGLLSKAPKSLFMFTLKDECNKKDHPFVHQMMQEHPNELKEVMQYDLQCLMETNEAATSLMRSFYHHKYGICGQKIISLLVAQTFASILEETKTIVEQRQKGTEIKKTEEKTPTQEEDGKTGKRAADEASDQIPQEAERAHKEVRTSGSNTETIATPDEEPTADTPPALTVQKSPEWPKKQTQQTLPNRVTTKDRQVQTGEELIELPAETEHPPRNEHKERESECTSMQNPASDTQKASHEQNPEQKVPGPGVGIIHMDIDKLEKLIKTPKGRKRAVEQMLPRVGEQRLSTWEQVDNTVTYRSTAVAKKRKQHADESKEANPRTQEGEEVLPIKNLQGRSKYPPENMTSKMFAGRNDLTEKEKMARVARKSVLGSRQAIEYVGPQAAWIHRCPVTGCVGPGGKETVINPHGLRRNLTVHIKGKRKDVDATINVRAYNKDKVKSFETQIPIQKQTM